MKRRPEMSLLVLGRIGLGALRRATFWWSVGLGGVVAATIAFWPAFKGASGISEAIGNLPAPIVEAFGLKDFGSPAGFLRGNLYELFVPLLYCLAGITLVNGQTAGDETSGRLELILAQPVARRAVYLARMLACVVALGAIVLVTLVVQLGMDAVVGLSIDTSLLTATVVLCGLLGLLHASLAYAIACLRPRTSFVLGIAVAAMFAGYVVNALFQLSTPLKPWRGISPWNWALAGEPLERASEPWRFAVLIALSAGLIVLGTLVVRRRDVAAA
ncbi:MAG TPA: ABC transporter permease subunit [Patescibacteria group bacterium]|nr:ABC transporter permease subunit [Patescibacteria group bacterium]